MQSFAILGIGNNLLQDDGAGIHALGYFSEHFGADDIDCIDAGTVGLALLDRLSARDGLVAVDAMRLSKAPGTVSVFEGTEMDAILRRHHGSVHELGLSDLLDALRLSAALPPLRAIVGIEPAEIDWGTQPTDAVAVAIPAAARHIDELITRWRAELATGDAA